ncbi:glycosyltransferase family 87 protein [Candidatus Leptofilum sp.]|uniref:glycosyltransferase family 87 protein n=1 Tax=Candidatus Leptofilum sp. TaxID=3241576 RepID=UPI003B59F72F
MSSSQGIVTTTFKKKLAAIAGILLLFALVTIGVQTQFTSKTPGANDFYPRWKGAQLFFQEGIDPYSEEATLAIQQTLYGRPATPEEDQALFVYPFYTVLTLFPLVWLPYSWVQAIWLSALIFSLGASLFIILDYLGWKMSLPTMAVALIWMIVMYNSSRTVIIGQYAGLILLWLAGCLWALRQKRDGLAGILLALTTIKPQMIFLVIPALAIWGIGQKRWRFAGIFAGSMLALVAVSFLMHPSWLQGFIHQLTSYPSYTDIGSPLWVITGYYFPQLGKPVEWGFILLCLGYLFYQWRRLPAVSAGSAEFTYLIGLTLIITNLVVIRTATTNYIVMYIPLLFLLQSVESRYGSLWTILFFVVTVIGTWGLFLYTVAGIWEHPINYLPLPFGLMFIFLLWGKKRLISKTQTEKEHVVIPS